jgi:ABC-type polysaccharide/polyol phosphate export permease
MNIFRRARKTSLNLVTQSYSTYWGLWDWLTPFSYTTNTIVRPVLGIILYTTLAGFVFKGSDMQWLVIALPIGTAKYIILSGITKSFAVERYGGTLPFLFSSTANRFTHYVSRVALHFPNGLISYTSGIVAAWLIVGLDFSQVNWISFLLAVLTTVASVTMFSALVGVISIATRDWSNMVYPIDNMLGLLSGTIIPLTVFHPAVIEFAKFLPMVNGIIAIRDSFTGAPISQAGITIAREAANGLVFLAVGYISFVSFEKVAKRHGTIELESQ